MSQMQEFTEKPVESVKKDFRRRKKFPLLPKDFLWLQPEQLHVWDRSECFPHPMGNFSGAELERTEIGACQAFISFFLPAGWRETASFFFFYWEDNRVGGQWNRGGLTSIKTMTTFWSRDEQLVFGVDNPWKSWFYRLNNNVHTHSCTHIHNINSYFIALMAFFYELISFVCRGSWLCMFAAQNSHYHYNLQRIYCAKNPVSNIFMARTKEPTWWIITNILHILGPTSKEGL